MPLFQVDVRGLLSILGRSPCRLTIEDISPVEKRVDFEVPWVEVAARLDKAYDKLRREVRLKGFRPGKVPRQVVEKLYKHRVEDEVARESVEMAIGQAVSEKQIAPIAPPTVDKLELKQGEPLRFSARVEIRSQVTPKDYTGVRVSAPPRQGHRRADRQGARGLPAALHRVQAGRGSAQSTAADDILLGRAARPGRRAQGQDPAPSRSTSTRRERGRAARPGRAAARRPGRCAGPGDQVPGAGGLAGQGLGRQGGQPARDDQGGARAARCRRSTTSWPRTPARPTRWPTCARRCASGCSRGRTSASSTRWSACWSRRS